MTIWTSNEFWHFYGNPWNFSLADNKTQWDLGNLVDRSNSISPTAFFLHFCINQLTVHQENSHKRTINSNELFQLFHASRNINCGGSFRLAICSTRIHQGFIVRKELVFVLSVLNFGHQGGGLIVILFVKSSITWTFHKISNENGV